jgi:hypothetical protein
LLVDSEEFEEGLIFCKTFFKHSSFPKNSKILNNIKNVAKTKYPAFISIEPTRKRMIDKMRNNNENPFFLVKVIITLILVFSANEL